MQNWETYQARMELFDLFECARVLYNNYCNGFDNNYNSKDIEKIKYYLENIEEDIKNIKEWI